MIRSPHRLTRSVKLSPERSAHNLPIPVCGGLARNLRAFQWPAGFWWGCETRFGCDFRSQWWRMSFGTQLHPAATALPHHRPCVLPERSHPAAALNAKSTACVTGRLGMTMHSGISWWPVCSRGHTSRYDPVIIALSGLFGCVGFCGGNAGRKWLVRRASQRMREVRLHAASVVGPRRLVGR